MIMDMYGNYFDYGQYITYQRKVTDKQGRSVKVPALGKIHMVKLAKKSSLIVWIYISHYAQKVALRKYNTVEIISREQAERLFSEEFQMIEKVWNK